MATPTIAQLRTDLQNSVNILEKLRSFGETDATNLIGLIDTYKDAVNTNFPSQRTAGISAIRSAFSTAIADSTVRSLLTPVLFDWGALVNAPEQSSGQAILDRMYQYFIDNAEFVQSRQITYGTPAAVTGTGTGQIHRLTVDDRNYALESLNPSLNIEARVRRDQNSGATKHQEIWELKDSDSGVDSVDRSSHATGLVGSLTTGGRKNALLRNSSFDSRGGSDSVPTSLPGWILLDSSDAELAVSSSLITFETDAANVYLEKIRDSETIRSINLGSTTQIKLDQKLNLQGISIDPAIPHYLQIAYNRQVNSAAGTLVLRLGSKSVTVAVSAQTGWNVARIAIGQENWLRDVNENNINIQVDWTPDSGGTGLLIDDVILAPFTPFAGSWYFAEPGRTPFLFDDKTSWSDSFASGISDGIVQKWLWRGFNRMLPHATGGSVTLADPS